MYKLFLCLRYLRSRVMAYFAVLAVALCVFMMLVVISVMDGFLHKIELAAKGLSGDIIVESTSLSGLGRYDEFIADLKKEMPDQVEAASPFILTYGLISLPHTSYRQTVQIAGIRLPERSTVTAFGEGLKFQKGLKDGGFDPPLEFVRQNIAADLGSTFKALSRDLPARYDTGGIYNPDLLKDKPKVDSAVLERGQRLAAKAPAMWDKLGLTGEEAAMLMAKLLLIDDAMSHEPGAMLNSDLGTFIAALDEKAKSDETFPQAAFDLAGRVQQAMQAAQLVTNDTLGRLWDSLRFHARSEDVVTHAEPFQAKLRKLDADISAAEARNDKAALDPLYKQREDLLTQMNFKSPEDRMILGMGIPQMSFRTDHGEVIRTWMMPGQTIALVLFPLGRGGMATNPTPTSMGFTVIDDCRTDVSSIDSAMVYVPFETLQKLNDMDEATLTDGTKVPARCSAIHIKVRDGNDNEQKLMAVRAKVQERWSAFYQKYPDALSGGTDVTVQTWRQRQHVIIASVSAQRTIVVIMFGIISTVAIVLVFVLFYTIVVQKTKDIGVIKAIGGSSFGVAQIFLGYGAAVGLVGSILGTIGGWIFVRNINPIHDWVGETFGLKLWDREIFLFDKIPNEVQVMPVVSIVIAAITAGLIGALLPAYLAGRMTPVEALRYE